MVLKRLQSKLKEVIRSQGLSYSAIGNLLKVSEATVKRLLNHEDVSFHRLEQLCEVLEVSFYDIISLSQDQGQKLYEYTSSQELLLARDEKNFLIFRFLIMGKTLDEICDLVMIDRQGLAQILKEMEDCELLERHAKERIKLMANFPFKWISGGSLERAYGPVLLKRVMQESLHVGVNRGDENKHCLLFEWGLSAKSHKAFVNELCQVYEKYKKVAEVEIKSLKKDFVPTSGIVSIGKYPMW